jgi:hypothetical protein
MVSGAVSFIQMFQIGAWEIFTFEAKRCFSFLENLAVQDLTSCSGNGFIGVCHPAAGTFISISQISHANGAVHAAGRDKRNLI